VQPNKEGATTAFMATIGSRTWARDVVLATQQTLLDWLNGLGKLLELPQEVSGANRKGVVPAGYQPVPATYAVLQKDGVFGPVTAATLYAYSRVAGDPSVGLLALSALRSGQMTRGLLEAMGHMTGQLPAGQTLPAGVFVPPYGSSFSLTGGTSSTSGGSGSQTSTTTSNTSTTSTTSNTFTDFTLGNPDLGMPPAGKLNDSPAWILVKALLSALTGSAVGWAVHETVHPSPAAGSAAGPRSTRRAGRAGKAGRKSRSRKSAGRSRHASSRKASKRRAH